MNVSHQRIFFVFWLLKSIYRFSKVIRNIAGILLPKWSRKTVCFIYYWIMVLFFDFLFEFNQFFFNFWINISLLCWWIFHSIANNISIRENFIPLFCSIIETWTWVVNWIWPFRTFCNPIINIPLSGSTHSTSFLFLFPLQLLLVHCSLFFPKWFLLDLSSKL